MGSFKLHTFCSSSSFEINFLLMFIGLKFDLNFDTGEQRVILLWIIYVYTFNGVKTSKTNFLFIIVEEYK